MESHSQINTQYPKALARKLNRLGITGMSQKEKEFIGQDVRVIAEHCTADRAKAVFEFFGHEMPKEFPRDLV